MNAVALGREQGAPRGRSDDVTVAALVLLASGALAARAWFPPLHGTARVLAAMILFGAILAGSLLVPAAPRTRRMSPIAAGAVGIGALAGAALVAGTPVPLTIAAWTLPLSILAAVAEEALFRRVAYARLARWGAPVAVVTSAALFALIHLPLYGAAALPVDLGAGLVFGWQRWATGSWGTPAATHAAANVVAMLR